MIRKDIRATPLSLCPKTLFNEDGRTTSLISTIKHENSTQNYNRYSYCINNPLKYTDPSGYQYRGYDPAKTQNMLDKINSNLQWEYYQWFEGLQNEAEWSMLDALSHLVGGAGGGGDIEKILTQMLQRAPLPIYGPGNYEFKKMGGVYNFTSGVGMTMMATVMGSIRFSKTGMLLITAFVKHIDNVTKAKYFGNVSFYYEGEFNSFHEFRIDRSIGDFVYDSAYIYIGSVSKQLPSNVIVKAKIYLGYEGQVPGGHFNGEYLNRNYWFKW